MLEGQKNKGGHRGNTKTVTARSSYQSWASGYKGKKSELPESRSSEEGPHRAGTQTSEEGVAWLVLVPWKHEDMASWNWDSHLWEHDEAASRSAESNVRSETSWCQNPLLLIKWSVQLMLDTGRSSPFFSLTVSLQCPSRQSLTGTTDKSINVCRVPAPASQSLEFRNNGLITCTLLYSEWQEFYWVILFPWMMFRNHLWGSEGEGEHRNC